MVNSGNVVTSQTATSAAVVAISPGQGEPANGAPSLFRMHKFHQDPIRIGDKHKTTKSSLDRFLTDTDERNAPLFAFLEQIVQVPHAELELRRAGILHAVSNRLCVCSFPA